MTNEQRVYKTPADKVRLYLAILRTYGRNIMNRKHEPEAPFIKDIIQPDDVCLHIGATDGRHSYEMAKVLKGGAGFICAYEPSPVTFPVLQSMVKLHGLREKVRIERKAFSNEEKVLTLNVPYKSSGRLGNSFGFTSDEKAEKGRDGKENPDILCFDVDAVTIDSTVSKEKLERVDFIRMDIEGSERLALDGGWETIKKFKPHMLIEIHPDMLESHFNASPQSIYDDLVALDYDVYHLESDRLVRSADLNIKPWKDYFFVHKDRAHNLSVS